MDFDAPGAVTHKAEATPPVARTRTNDVWLALILAAFAFFAFYYSTKGSQKHFDYTERIAAALLHGHLGLQSKPPSWLNEMVPRDDRYYSVFPLGAVVSMIPVALLQEFAGVREFPARFVASILAAACVYFFYRLSAIKEKSIGGRILLALFPIFGTWTWCNLGLGGAWQLALGFAVLGEVGALYFTLARPSAVVAGAFFALAVGNRTELVVTLPAFFYLWSKRPSGAQATWQAVKIWAPEQSRIFAKFLIVPAILGVATAAYNFARFQSVFDFGYSHIPNVLNEPWYRAGLFSFHAIPWNMHKMLFEGMTDIHRFPFLRPHAFGCSIFLVSPMLFLLFREGGKYRLPAWTAIAFLTFVLWCHGNPGGWQFSYRYGMVLIPWMYLLILTNGPRRASAHEIALFAVSVAINAIGTYEFVWTDWIKP